MLWTLVIMKGRIWLRTCNLSTMYWCFKLGEYMDQQVQHQQEQGSETDRTFFFKKYTCIGA
jgi:hypothetical protein